jgi:hypothetical protein
MLFFKYMLLVVGVGMFVVAAAIVANDLWLTFEYRRKMMQGAVAIEPQPVRWRITAALVCVAWAPILIGMSLVVPAGNCALRHPHAMATVAAVQPR